MHVYSSRKIQYLSLGWCYFTFAQHFKVKCDLGLSFFCLVLVAEGIHAMGFKHAQNDAHCAKFESYINRMTFKTDTICTTPDIQPPYLLKHFNIIILENNLIEGVGRYALFHHSI